MNFDLEKVLESLCVIIISVASAIKWVETKRKMKEMESKTEVSKVLVSSTLLEADIIKYMEQSKEETRADRVLLFEFHNGGHYADGRKALKTSCTFEVDRYGIKAVQTELKDIVLSRFVKSLNLLFKKGYVDRLNIKDAKDIDGALYDLMFQGGVEWLTAKIIKNKSGDPVGFALWEYCTPIDIKVDVTRMDEFIGVVKEKLIELINQ